MVLTQKQETFCLNLFQGMSQRDAYIAAGYSPRQSPATIDRHACDLAKTDKILARTEELRQAAEDASVATVLERKQVLTEIVRGRFADFFAERQLSLLLKWTSPGRELTFETFNFQHWDFFFLFAFLIGFYSIHRLTRVREVGEVEEEIVVNELISQVRRDMRNLSTVGGLRQVVNFPVSVLFFPVSVAKRMKRGKNLTNRRGGS